MPGKKALHKMIRDNCGTAAVELAIVAPVFLVLVFGIIDVGRAFWSWNAMEYAVENTARYALVNEDATDAELKDYAQTSMGEMQPDTAGLSIDVTRTTVSGIDMIKVEGAYGFSPLFPMPETWNLINLSANAHLAAP